MSREEKIRCGAYVYFSFLRPFAAVAGIADELDWTVPRDLPETDPAAALRHRGREHSAARGRALLPGRTHE